MTSLQVKVIAQIKKIAVLGGVVIIGGLLLPGCSNASNHGSPRLPYQAHETTEKKQPKKRPANNSEEESNVKRAIKLSLQDLPNVPPNPTFLTAVKALTVQSNLHSITQ